jgi:hypothetical protein
LDLFKHTTEASNPNNNSDLKLPFFQPRSTETQSGNTYGQVMRTPLPEGPAEKKDDPTKVLTEGIAVVKDELDNKPGYEEWQDKQTDALKKDLQRKTVGPGEKGITTFVGKEGETGDGAVKEETGLQEVKTTEIKAINGTACDPKGVTIDVFLNETGKIGDAFGVTNLIPNDVTMPEVTLVNGVLQKTSAGLAARSFYLLPQTFKDKFTHNVQDPSGEEDNFCPPKAYDRYWEINQAGSDKVKEGEQEHCNDFNLAYTLSIAKFRDAVNTAADTGKQFKSDAAAKAYLKTQTGIHPDKWSDNFWCLATKSKLRDANKWHQPPNIKPKVDKHCLKAIMLLGANSLPEIGKHPSTEIIKDCNV